MLDRQAQQDHAPRESADGAASTNGWDTVFAVNFEAVSAGIAAQGTSPTSFPPQGTSADISGTYGDWRLTGGSGARLKMTLPIPTFTLAGGGASETRRNAEAIIDITLHSVSEPRGHGVRAVSFRSAPPRGPGRASATYGVVVTSFAWPAIPGEQASSDQEGLLRSACMTAFADVFREEAASDEFDHAFVTVNLGERVAGQDAELSWLSPQGEPSYGVVEDARAPGGGYFAVMCMTSGAEAPDSHAVDPKIADGAGAGFLIGKPLVLEHLLKPGVALMFGREPGDTAFLGTFDIDGNAIVNRERIDIPEFRLSEDETIAATVPGRAFGLVLNDKSLSYRLNGLNHDYAWFLGGYQYRAHHYLQTDLIMAYDPATRTIAPAFESEGGEDVISYRALLEKSDRGKKVDVALLVGEIVTLLLSVGIAVQGARAAKVGAEIVAGADTAQATSILARSWSAVSNWFVGLKTLIERSPLYLVASLAFGAAGIAVNLWRERFENAREDDPTLFAPDMQDFVRRATAPIVWPHGTGLELEHVELSGGLRLVGTPDFTAAGDAS